LTGPTVSIEPWTADDRPLLDALLGVPEMTEYLGGPESTSKLDERQARYVNNPRSMRIVVDGEAVGWVGYWEVEADGGQSWETGWSVRREGIHRYVHATPTIDNAASNALCRKLGFELLEEIDFEYPPGNPVRGNDWRLDLAGGGMKADPG